MSTLLAYRKTVYKLVRHRLRKAELEVMAKKAREDLKIGRSHVKNPSRAHGACKGVREMAESAGIAESASATLEAVHSATLGWIEGETRRSADEEELEDDAGVDESAMEEYGRGPSLARVEPDCWENLGNDVEIRVDRDIDPSQEQDHSSDRIKFLKAWIAKADSVIGNTNLLCPLCQIDPTISQTERGRRYVLNQLDRHCKSDFHARDRIIRRAWQITSRRTGSDKVSCPVCSSQITGLPKFMDHVNKYHPQAMWAENDDGTRGDFGDK